ncbi:MAG: hypothetical protein KC912_19715 [Proteobacteria bacterium]|nr:hypothetical protein [Pseudomonadota bacterium]
MAPNKSEFTETIHAPVEAVWDVLFHQYGDIHVHNPTMQSSGYMNGATKGEVGCLRHTEFSDKLFLDEAISDAVDQRRLTVVATEHNLPFLREMSAIYELSPNPDGTTELRMTSSASTFPSFMIYLMRGQLGQSLKKHLFGMKYYIETGKTVDMDQYDEVFEGYRSTPLATA